MNEPTSKDTRLYARAAAKRWDVSEQHKALVLNHFTKVLLDPEKSTREKDAAARGIIDLEKQNQKDEHVTIEIDERRNRFADIIDAIRIEEAEEQATRGRMEFDSGSVKDIASTDERG